MLYVEKLLVETFVQNFVIRGPLVTKLPRNTKYTNGPKVVDPRLAVVSPYFKESMPGILASNQKLAGSHLNLLRVCGKS